MVLTANSDWSAILVRRLGAADDVAGWTCGDEPWAQEVADYLIEDALNQMQLGMAVTLVFEHDSRIAGFCSILGNSLREKDEPSTSELNLGYGEFPCLLLSAASGFAFRKEASLSRSTRITVAIARPMQKP